MNHESPGLQVVVKAGKPGDALRIHAAGELDLATLGVLRDALDSALEAGPGDVEVEMSAMTFCDSSGLCLLLTVQRRFHAAGRQLRLLDPGPAVVRLLDLSSTRQFFDVRTTSSTPRAAGPTYEPSESACA
jgi:anti-anti-sigma factor